MYFNNINKFRMEQHLTLEKLSKVADISVGYLCHLENGSRNNPSMNTMKKICKALNKSLTEVFYF